MMEGYDKTECNVCGSFAICIDGICEECWKDFEEDTSDVVIPFDDEDEDTVWTSEQKWDEVSEGHKLISGWDDDERDDT